jgi:hypothetical protein
MSLFPRTDISSKLAILKYWRIVAPALLIDTRLLASALVLIGRYFQGNAESLWDVLKGILDRIRADWPISVPSTNPDWMHHSTGSGQS